MKLLLIFVSGMLVLTLSVLAWVIVYQPSDETISPTPETVVSPSPLASESPQVYDYKDQIQLFQPLPEASISSPLTIDGQARGTWFFEGDFPVVLTDWDGLIIAQGYAQAETDWMTQDWVPFTVELEFTTPEYNPRGSLILQKANPSGLPENDDALEITVYFETTP